MKENNIRIFWLLAIFLGLVTARSTLEPKYNALFSRDETIDDLCRPACSRRSFHAGLRRRSFDHEVSEKDDTLHRRNLEPVTNIDTYMLNRLESVNLIDVFFNDLTSTARMQPLGNAPFPMGLQGLCGCSTLFVMSRRAVYGAHFFEDLAFTTTSPDRFKAQTINMISGDGSITGEGPSLDPTFFNQPGDKPVAWILTPESDKVPGNQQYPKRIGQIGDQVAALIPGIRVSVFIYNALQGGDQEKGIPADPEFMTNARGAALYGYDPNNHGGRAYRLFFERTMVAKDEW
ncbi:hypothetical protein LTR66_009229 [Elasticomyces elasticus]|nr:hypothetical protein LTR66_009229 [Elasticomyces elasticus]